MIERLLDQGANINDRDLDGVTPLNFVANSENAEIVTAMVLLGANPVLPAKAEGIHMMWRSKIP